jgi:F0F1-type ATP synthase membrane subunit c/vacuolar-type H+-ATPase subunit K
MRLILKLVPWWFVGLLSLAAPAFASADTALQFFPTSPAGNKFLAAGLAIGMSAIAAGWAIGRAGSAGLAAAAERPEVRTTGIIISALGEALAIYGLIVALLILGAEA